MKHRKWKPKDKALLLKKLSIFLANGYTLAAAIELLCLSHVKDHEKQLLQNVICDLRDGRPVYVAFEQLQLPDDILSYLYFSDQYGNLIQGLEEAGNLYFQREDFKEHLLKLLRYPLFLLWLLVILSFVMVKNLFPHFQEIYSSVSLELPLITRFFLHFIDFIPFLISLILIAISIVIILYWTKFRKWSSHKKISYLLKIPILSSIIRNITTYFFATQLSGLLKGGMQIYQALFVFAKQEKLNFFKKEAEIIIEYLQQGESLVDILSSRIYFSPELSKVVLHGQHQSQLDKELYMYGEILFQRLNDQAKRYMMIVQPTLFLVIGLIVLVMFTALLMPMFELINSLN